MLIDAVAAKSVLDTQTNYRILLDCMARPGTIGHFRVDASVEVPSGLNRATASIAFVLLSQDVTICAPFSSETVLRFLERDVKSVLSEESSADFILLAGMDSVVPLESAKVGRRSSVAR